jgi:adenosylcobinamide kinase/adenosylcobinamide-phosphate guanylyltransferase
MPGQIIFITGAARSGKSRFAESLARSHGGSVAYVPTAQITDGEMRRRVSIHRARRPAEWETVECPGTLADALGNACASHDVVLVDCLTVYLSRLLPMIEGDTLPLDAEEAAETRMEGELLAIVDTVRAHEAATIIVSNEVGAGVVPPYPAGRLYRDLVGRAGQYLVEAADFAYLVVAGVPLDLKSLVARIFPWRYGGE